MIIILSHYFWSLNKWEAHMQTVVIPTPIHLTAKSAVFPIIVVSKNKRYPEFILYGWSFILLLKCDLFNERNYGHNLVLFNGNWLEHGKWMFHASKKVLWLAHEGWSLSILVNPVVSWISIILCNCCSIAFITVTKTRIKLLY